MRYTPIFLCIILLGGLFACKNTKNLVYFERGADSEGPIKMREVYLEVGDILSIEVTAADPDIAKPFNQAELVRQGNQSGSYDNGVAASFGYLIYEDGTVNLPIVGRIKLLGLSRSEAIREIERALGEYIESPSISLRILNFKITILGEVENPGTYTIPNERITILEALGISHDLKITGKRTNVMVIRTENGMRKEYRVDLSSKDLFDSDVYYLKQNDVVYVEPNSKSRYDATLIRSAGGVIISATSLIVSTLILIVKY